MAAKKRSKKKKRVTTSKEERAYILKQVDLVGIKKAADDSGVSAEKIYRWRHAANKLTKASGRAKRLTNGASKAAESGGLRDVIRRIVREELQAAFE